MATLRTRRERDGFAVEPESASISRWHRILAWIEIATGVGAGTVAALPFLVSSEATNQFSLSVLQVSALLLTAALSLGAGWRLLRGGDGSWTLSALLFALQIPIVNTPQVLFSFYAGPRALVTFWPRFSGEFGFGFGLSVGQGSANVGIGINLIALAVVAQLVCFRARGLTPVAGDVGPGIRHTSGSEQPHASEPFR